MRIIYEKFPLSDVMGYFIEAFKPHKGEKIVSGKWYIDQHQQVVIFELTLDDAVLLIPEEEIPKHSER